MQKSLGSLLLSVLLVTAFVLAATTKVAHAYIDISYGSFLIQILLGTAFGTLFMIKVFWRRLTGQLSRFLSKMRTLKVPMR